MSVFINNLDDYIAPSQACVNPMVLSRGKGAMGKIQLESDFSTTEFEETQKPDLIKLKSGSVESVATISLNDCLACSGCITSAEAVLVQNQSYERMMDMLSSGAATVAVSLSPQSIASLAHYLHLSTPDTFFKLATFLKSIGVHYVMDLASADAIALHEAYNEYQSRSNRGYSTEWSKPPPSTAISSTSQFTTDITPLSTEDTGHLPLICSHCPGWICYAEKTVPEIIPYLSTVKSTQQIMGSILKHALPKQPRPWYHVCVEPCFDKKLEGSRKDFYHEDTDSNEVDLVVSTTEFIHLLSHYAGSSDGDAIRGYVANFPVDTQPADAYERMMRTFTHDGRFASPILPSSTSGSYLEHIYRCITAADGNPGYPLTLIPGRNKDIAEAEYVTSDGKTLRFAYIYGFRNIQGLIMKMKRRKVVYDYVEVMACPSGCINGGGQIKVADKETPDNLTERVAATSSLYMSNRVENVGDWPLLGFVYSQPKDSNSIRRLLHTQFHAIPKLEEVAPLAAKW